MEEKFKFEDAQVFLMKNKSYVLGPCPTDETGMLKHIELCGRVCYKSEDKITEDSYKKFFKMIMNKKHLSVIEHSNMAFKIKFYNDENATEFLKYLKYYSNLFNQGQHIISGYSTPNPTDTTSKFVIVSMNLRVYYEFLLNLCLLYRTTEASYNDNISALIHILMNVGVVHYNYIFNTFVEINSVLSDVKSEIYNSGELCCGYCTAEETYINRAMIYMLSPKDLKEANCIYNDIIYTSELNVHTVKFITNRGISHEIARTRTFSISQESTRYVNYTKCNNYYYTDIFNNNNSVNTDEYSEYILYLEEASNYYNALTTIMPPQFSRNILPHSTKTEIICSGREGTLTMFKHRSGKTSASTPLSFKTGWMQFLEMRNSSGAHPEFKALLPPINEYFSYKSA